MKSRRLFLAIPVTRELILSVNSQKEKLDLPVKWIPDENLHVTLHFFGNVEEASLIDLTKTIKNHTQQFPPFTMEVNSILLKPGKGQTMVWAGFKEAPSFEKLALAIAKSINAPVSRKPLPHINLARHKERIKSDRLPLLFNTPQRLEVTHFELWESKLSPKGSTYFSLECFTLNGK